MKPRRISFGTHVGTSLILLIFMVLCLISFATLSLVNATADRRLTAKLSDRQEAYYAACHEAEVFILSEGARLEQLRDKSSGESAFLRAADSLTLYRTFAVSDSQCLEVELIPDYGAERGSRIGSYRIITEEQEEPDETLPLYTGE